MFNKKKNDKDLKGALLMVEWHYNRYVSSRDAAADYRRLCEAYAERGFTERAAQLRENALIEETKAANLLVRYKMALMEFKKMLV